MTRLRLDLGTASEQLDAFLNRQEADALTPAGACPAASGSKPTPSSRTSNRTCSSSCFNSTHTSFACACRVTLVSVLLGHAEARRGNVSRQRRTG